MNKSLRERLETALGVRIARASAVSGGSINEAFVVETDRGLLFVKHHCSPPVGATPASLGFFAAEADGLARLGAVVPVPAVLAVLDDALALEYVPPTARTPALEAVAGHALADLHAREGERFGLEVDNFMGAVPQDNRPASRPDYATFFRERRIAPLAHHLPPALRARLENLSFEDVLEPTTPRLVHGDLWSGNLHWAATPTFIDPAVHYGHPEQDLAMTRLFGGFTDAFFGAYRERSGLVPDRDFHERLEILNLYPLLVHVALFGGGYVRAVEAIVTKYC